VAKTGDLGAGLEERGSDPYFAKKGTMRGGGRGDQEKGARGQQVWRGEGELGAGNGGGMNKGRIARLYHKGDCFKGLRIIYREKEKCVGKRKNPSSRGIALGRVDPKDVGGSQWAAGVSGWPIKIG